MPFPDWTCVPSLAIFPHGFTGNELGVKTCSGAKKKVFTISIFPLLSHTRLRGLVNPPRTLVAFQPLARLYLKTAAPTPEQEAGIVAFAAADFGGVILVAKVVAGLAVVAGAATTLLAVAGLAGASAKRLLETQELKLGLRAAFRS